MLQNLVTIVIYEWAFKARMFASGKPFQPSLIFASKDVPSLQEPGQKGLPETNTLAYLTRIVQYGRKKLDDIGNWSLGSYGKRDRMRNGRDRALESAEEILERCEREYET